MQTLFDASKESRSTDMLVKTLSQGTPSSPIVATIEEFVETNIAVVVDINQGI